MTTMSIECGICGELSSVVFPFLYRSLLRPVSVTVAVVQWLLKVNVLQPQLKELRGLQP